MFAHWKLTLGLLVPLTFTMMGCGSSGPELGEVDGVITLDGQPLANADVEFQPLDGGAPSYAITDDQGHYEIQYTMDRYGAVPGQHEVKITTYGFALENGQEVKIPERVPARYNHKSELKVDVKPGDNTHDFDLASDGEILENPDLVVADGMSEIQ